VVCDKSGGYGEPGKSGGTPSAFVCVRGLGEGREREKQNGSLPGGATKDKKKEEGVVGGLVLAFEKLSDKHGEKERVLLRM